MNAPSTGRGGPTTRRPLLTGLVWFLVIAAAFGGWQAWRSFLAPHERTLVVEAEADPFSAAASDAERVLAAAEVEFREPEIGATVLRLSPTDVLPRTHEITMRGSMWEHVLDEGRLEAWLHIGPAPPGTRKGEDETSVSVALAPPRVEDGKLLYRFGLDDAVRVLGRRLRTEISVRDALGFEVTGLASERADEVVEDAARPGVYRVAIGVSYVIRAREENRSLEIEVRAPDGRDGVLRIPPRWLEGESGEARVVPIDWTGAPLSSSATSVARGDRTQPADRDRIEARSERSPARTDDSAAAPPKPATTTQPEPTTPTDTGPDPAELARRQQARMDALLDDGRTALAAEDWRGVEEALDALASIPSASELRQALRERLDTARAAAQRLERMERLRERFRRALAEGALEDAERALDEAEGLVEDDEITRWRQDLEGRGEELQRQAERAARERDLEGVREALRRFEQAHNTLDVGLVYEVFPTYGADRGLEREALAKAWENYTSQRFALDPVGQIELQGDEARVRCTRMLEVETRFGRPPEVPPARMEVRLRRQDDAWILTGLELVH